MHSPVTQRGEPGDFASFRAVVCISLRQYFRHAGALFSILFVRLVPFYVFLWYFPVDDTAMHAIAGTLVVVPALAALVRFAWETVATDAPPTIRDALLGASPVVTLKLLGTNLLVVFVVVLLSPLGPTLFIGLVFVWSLVNLITDQVVVIEGLVLFKAILRSLELVRQVWPVSAGLLLVIVIPDVASLIVYSTVEHALWREVITHGIDLLTMPFSAFALTSYYQLVRSNPS